MEGCISNHIDREAHILDVYLSDLKREENPICQLDKEAFSFLSKK